MGPGARGAAPALECRALYAARAARAFRAMQREWRRDDGRYRRDGRLRRLGLVAHLWPFLRALVATLDLAGLTAPVDGFDAEAQISSHLGALESYWDDRGGRLPAYASDPPGTPFGADRYYDDNAWAGLALMQLQRMRPGAQAWRLDRVAQLLGFVRAGWDGDRGGVFWVEQGRGTGRRNHDRNAVSTAPNAQLALHLAQLGGATGAPTAELRPERMLAWVHAVLDSSGDRGAGPFWDRLRGDGSIDRALWSYNQGSMVGAYVLLARRRDSQAAGHLARAEAAAGHLAQAEAIARRALRHYAASGYARQPAAFNAIFFRNLLLLHAVTTDAGLQTEIVTAMRGYADHAWGSMRDDHDRFARAGERPTLLEQAGIVQVLALLAWDPADYGRLA